MYACRVTRVCVPPDASISRTSWAAASASPASAHAASADPQVYASGFSRGSDRISASNRVAIATPSGRYPAARINLLYVASGMSASDARIASNASKAYSGRPARVAASMSNANVLAFGSTRPSSVMR